jgi:hypothetical protein
MSRFRAYRCRTLLVLVLLGFTAATLHISMHVSADPQSCQLCGGHFSPAHAVAPTNPLPVLAPAVAVTAAFVLRLHSSRPFVAYRERAPPVLT